MFHYIRDCNVPRRGSTIDNGGYLEALFVVYHFLRTAGFANIYEIDGHNNHVSDGGMEETTSPPTYWTKEPAAGGATVDFSTSNVHMGKQSLEVISSAIDEGVRSVDMNNIEVSRTYQVRFQVLNNTGRSWNVDVQTGSVGVWANIGTVPSSPSMQEFTAQFTSSASVTTNHALRIIDNNYSTTPGTIYVDSVVIYESFFETKVSEDHLTANVDGKITAPDQFDSSSYSFVSGAAPTGDEGKYLCVWDPTNLGNSGVYEVTSVVGGVATLDLRAGGTPSLTSNGANDLRWRLIDPKNQAPYQYDPGVDRMQYCGFGLESPHTEKWRIFFRANFNTSGDYTWMQLWTSGYDADFDVYDGDFLTFESSTDDTKGSYSKGAGSGRFCIKGQNPGIRNSTGIRIYLMTDDDKSFINILFRDVAGTYPDSVGGGFVGFTGADSYHTLRESFCCLFPTEAQVDAYQDIDFRSDGYSFSAHGAQHSDLGKGWMTRCTLMNLGYGDTTGDELDLSSVNYRANPYDNQHWIRKPKIARDYDGLLSNNPTEKTMDNVGLWHSTKVADWTTIDSNSYLHIRQGFYWEWWDGHEPLT